MSKQDTIISLLREINESVDDLDTTFVTTDLAITENGLYKPIDYNVEGFNIVDVNVSPTLEEITITENGEYIPSEGVDGFSKVVATLPEVKIPKVKVTSFTISEFCVVDGVWEGDQLLDTSELTSLSLFCQNIKTIKKLDVSNWDVSKVQSLNWCFSNCNFNELVGVDTWNVKKATSMNYFGSQLILETPCNFDLRHWDVSNVTNLSDFYLQRDISYEEGKHAGKLNIEGWDTSKVTKMGNILHNNYFNWINIVGISGESLTGYMYTSWFLSKRTDSLVGDYTIDDVINKDLKILAGIKVDHGYVGGGPWMNRATLRAIINGLADLTGGTSGILSLSFYHINKLSEEDIAIVTNKNWTIESKNS